MKLEVKLGLGTGGLIFGMLLSAFSANLRIAESNRLESRVMTIRIPFLMCVRDVRAHISRSVRALERNMLLEEHGGLEASQEAERTSQFEKAEASLAFGLEIAKQPGVEAGAKRLASLVDILARLKPLEERVQALTKSGSPSEVQEANALLEHDILALDDSASATLQQISEDQMALAQSESERLSAANQLTLITLWTLTVLGAIVGGSLSFVLGRRIVNAVTQLAERADCIAGGDLTQAPLNVSWGDQIGTLAGAMDRMQTSLGRIIGTVADTAGSLTGSALSMRTASDGIHRRIDQQSQQTQQAATAMQEMSASIAEVSRHTQSAAETARSAALTAREGGEIVKQMLVSMHSIAAAVTETSSTVGLLGEDSKRISQIVTVIDEIARKTNLLALNAAIEAARAGDQGRGFAVVAGEVRRLAESTAQATGEIGTMIHEIQDRTRSAIASMASGTGTVQEGVVTTTQAGESLERIIGMAERVDRMITQIAIAAQQQAAAADQSSASLDSIHTLSHENLTEMATTAAGIETLRGTAVTLERQVDRFQVA
jgi:methyl-accepting chemotaxis protein